MINADGCQESSPERFLLGIPTAGQLNQSVNEEAFGGGSGVGGAA